MKRGLSMRMSAYPSTSRIERELSPEEEILNAWEFRAFDDDRYIYRHTETGEWAMSLPVHELRICVGEVQYKADDRDYAIRSAISHKLTNPDENVIVISAITGEIIFEAKNLTITGEGGVFYEI